MNYFEIDPVTKEINQQRLYAKKTMQQALSLQSFHKALSDELMYDAQMCAFYADELDSRSPTVMGEIERLQKNPCQIMCSI